jgi:hypothetical protein
MMTNKQIARQMLAFQATRQEWLNILVLNPRNNTAAGSIMSINHKIELLQSFWNWSDESVDFPY